MTETTFYWNYINLFSCFYSLQYHDIWNKWMDFLSLIVDFSSHFNSVSTYSSNQIALKLILASIVNWPEIECKGMLWKSWPIYRWIAFLWKVVQFSWVLTWSDSCFCSSISGIDNGFSYLFDDVKESLNSPF